MSDLPTDLGTLLEAVEVVMGAPVADAISDAVTDQLIYAAIRNL